MRRTTPIVTGTIMTKPPGEFRRSALFGLGNHIWDQAGNRWRLRLRPGRIAMVAGLLSMILYLGVAWVKYAENKWIRECKETSFREMCLFIFPDRIPFTNIVWAPEFITRRTEAARDSHRAKLAAMLLELARADMRNGNWSKFFQNVFVATSLDHKNRDARMLAAFALFNLRRDDDAMESLEQSLPELLDNRDFVRDFLLTCLSKEQDERLIGVAKYHLKNSTLKPEIREFFMATLAGAHYFRGEFDEALRLTESPALLRNRDAFMLRVNILTELNDIKGALAIIEKASASNPNDADLISQIISLKKLLGDTEGARTAATVYQITSSQLYQPRIRFMELLDPVADKARLNELTQSYIRDFAQQETPLLALGEFASKSGDIALCERLMNHSRDAKFKQAPRFRLLYVESNLVAKEYKDTVRLVDEIFVENPSWLASYRLAFDCLRMVAHFALNREDTGEIAFKRIAESTDPLQPKFMETVAKRLVEADRPEEAVRIGDLCYQKNGRNITALASRITIQLDAGGTPETPALLRQYFAHRRLPLVSLRKARKIIAGDAYLFEPDRDALIRDTDTLIAGKPLVKTVPEKKPPAPVR